MGTRRCACSDRRSAMVEQAVPAHHGLTPSPRSVMSSCVRQRRHLAAQPFLTPAADATDVRSLAVHLFHRLGGPLVGGAVFRDGSANGSAFCSEVLPPASSAPLCAS